MEIRMNTSPVGARQIGAEGKQYQAFPAVLLALCIALIGGGELRATDSNPFSASRNQCCLSIRLRWATNATIAVA